MSAPSRNNVQQSDSAAAAGRDAYFSDATQSAGHSAAAELGPPLRDDDVELFQLAARQAIVLQCARLESLLSQWQSESDCIDDNADNVLTGERPLLPRQAEIAFPAALTRPKSTSSVLSSQTEQPAHCSPEDAYADLVARQLFGDHENNTAA